MARKSWLDPPEKGRWGSNKKATYAPKDERRRRKYTQPYREDNHRWESESHFDHGERFAPSHDNTFEGIWRERDREAKAGGFWSWVTRDRKEPRM